MSILERTHPETAGQNLSRSELIAVARHWASQAANLSSEMGPLNEQPADRRWFYRLQTEHNYEVWLMGWNQDQSTDFHNHGGSSGAVVVASGELIEERLTQAGDKSTRNIAAGHVTAFGPEAIHNVFNAGRGRSISVHVYSPPLSQMTYFEVAKGELRTLETIDVESPEPDGDEITFQ